MILFLYFDYFIHCIFFLSTFRCGIPECDPVNPAEQIYEPNWLQFTTPYKGDMERPQKCQRYAALTGSKLVNGMQSRCEASYFDKNKTEHCSNWVFDDYENTIGTEVSTSNLWTK